MTDIKITPAATVITDSLYDEPLIFMPDSLVVVIFDKEDKRHEVDVDTLVQLWKKIND